MLMTNDQSQITENAKEIQSYDIRSEPKATEWAKSTNGMQTVLTGLKSRCGTTQTTILLTIVSLDIDVRITTFFNGP